MLRVPSGKVCRGGGIRYVLGLWQDFLKDGNRRNIAGLHARFCHRRDRWCSCQCRSGWQGAEYGSWDCSTDKPENSSSVTTSLDGCAHSEPYAKADSQGLQLPNWAVPFHLPEAALLHDVYAWPL